MSSINCGHSLGGGANALKAFQIRRVEFTGAVFHDGEAESVDGPKGCAQVVRKGIAERFQFAIGGFKLERPSVQCLIGVFQVPVAPVCARWRRERRRRPVAHLSLPMD